MKVVSNLAFLLLTFICFSWTNKQQSGKHVKHIIFPYDTLKYDKVIAYDYDGGKGAEIVLKGQLQKGLVKNEKEVSHKQISEIHKVLRDTKTYGGGKASCFDPHLALIYYKGNKIVGYITICLECNYLESSIEITASETKKIYYCDTCKGYYFADGFSKVGRVGINDFCKELNFSHCKDNLVSAFDK